MAHAPKLLAICAACSAAVVLGGCAAHPTASSRAADPAAAARAALLPKDQVLAAWDRLKSLQGSWTGRSSKGWTEQVDYKVIAAGSCMYEISFGAHPNETMLTTWTLDTDRVVLTHYCVAKNQPRLLLTAIDADTYTFEFLDATNLSSRDTGHMDKYVLTFTPEGFTGQWTWYQKGSESWMERIEHKRTGQ